MSDSLTDSVARLYRSGSEHSKSTERLRKSADALLCWISANIPYDLKPLPMNCTLYPSGEFVQTKLSNPPFGKHEEVFKITIGREHTRADLFHFSELIANGFLDELSELLEKDTERSTAISNRIANAVNMSPSKTNQFKLTFKYYREVGYQGRENAVVTKNRHVSLDTVYEYCLDHTDPKDYRKEVTSPLGFSIHLTFPLKFPDIKIYFEERAIHFE